MDKIPWIFHRATFDCRRITGQEMIILTVTTWTWPNHPNQYVMGKASCTQIWQMTFSSECKYVGKSWQPTMVRPCPRLLFWLIVSTRVEYWMFPQSSYMLLFQDPSKSCHIERAQVRQQPNTMYQLVIWHSHGKSHFLIGKPSINYKWIIFHGYVK